MRGGEDVERLVRDRERRVEREPPAVRDRDPVDARAVEQLHHEERGAVLGDVLVDHRHRAWMLDAVRDVALPQEARADRGVVRELRVEHLDREALRVPVRGGVDGRHPAGAEHLVEDVLAAEDGPDPRRGAGVSVIVCRRVQHPTARSVSPPARARGMAYSCGR